MYQHPVSPAAMLIGFIAGMITICRSKPFWRRYCLLSQPACGSKATSSYSSSVWMHSVPPLAVPSSHFRLGNWMRCHWRLNTFGVLIFSDARLVRLDCVLFFFCMVVLVLGNIRVPPISSKWLASQGKNRTCGYFWPYILSFHHSAVKLFTQHLREK